MVIRGWVRGAVAVAAGMVLASCAYGITRTAGPVTPTTAVIRGAVGDTEGGWVVASVEIGPTTEYGSSNYLGTIWTEPRVNFPVETEFLTLRAATDYHYRVCAYRFDDFERVQTCGKDATFTTPDGDTVIGSGSVGTVSIPGSPYFYSVDGEVWASSAPDGSGASGFARTSPGLAEPRDLVHQGRVSCLRVVGNRAAIGFTYGPPSSLPEVHYVVFVEDNGPSGDRWGARLAPAATTTCPVPGDADFPPLVNGSSTLQYGDYEIRDVAP